MFIPPSNFAELELDWRNSCRDKNLLTCAKSTTYPLLQPNNNATPPLGGRWRHNNFRTFILKTFSHPVHTLKTMEEHLRELREELTAKQQEVQALQERVQSMDAEDDEMQRKLLERKLQEMREDYFELKRQLNSTLVSYNQSTALEQTLPFGQRPFPPDRLNEIQSKLAIPLTRDEIATRSGGGRQELIYVETHRVMEKLLEIFQFSCSIEVKSEPQVCFRVEGKNSLVMKCIIRVTLQNGCFHEDVGVHISHMNDTAESVRMSTKSCVSDGIKRALQHFGPALGSCLRDKDYTNDHLASQQPQKQFNGNQLKGNGVRLAQPPQQQNGASNTYNDHKKMKITPPQQQQQFQRAIPQPPPPQQQQQQPRVLPPPITPITPRQPINGWADDHSNMPSLSASSTVTPNGDELTPPPPTAAANAPGGLISSSATDDDDYKTWAMMEEAMKASSSGGK